MGYLEICSKSAPGDRQLDLRQRRWLLKVEYLGRRVSVGYK